MNEAVERVALAIHHSPLFAFDIMFSKAERNLLAGHNGWYFHVTCVVPHSKGRFTYEGRDICFELEAFEHFSEQLEAMRTGKASNAELAEVGRMLTLGLEVQGRRTIATIRICEAQTDNDMTLLSAGFKVDYDQFVNKLCEDLREFNRKLRDIRPEPV
jgi:hypothetical protein